eukprot:jgi/Psemu1/5719/gm1.5719_g
MFDEASKTATRTKGVPAVLIQVETVSDGASKTATTTNIECGVEAVPQGAATKVPAAHPKANPSQRKPPPAGLVHSPSLSRTNTKAVASLSEEDLDYQKHRRSVEKNLGSALNGQTYANRKFVKALSLDVSTYFTQLMTKVYMVSKIIQSKPMPNFRKKSPTESPNKKKKKKKESSLSTFSSIPRQIVLIVDLTVWLGSWDKWDNFQSLLQQVHGEREVGDTRPYLYGYNVVYYVTIKKYMVVYWEILVWYIDNVEYPPVPENMEKGLCFDTKCDNGSSHNSRKYVPVMKQFFDDLIAKLALRVSISQSYNQTSTLDNYFKPKHVECLESLPSDGIELVPQNESKDYVHNKLMNSTKPRRQFGSCG